MAVGDSLTIGYNDLTGGFRKPLCALLTADGIAFDMVGPNSDGSGFDAAHAAWAGQSIADISADVETAIGTYDPHVILLGVGAVDIIEAQTPAQVAASIAGMLDMIYATDPGITVILAKLFPMDTVDAEDVIALNALLDDIAAGYPHTHVVDKHTGFDLAWLDTDDIHMINPTGWEFVAHRVYYGILRVLA